MKLAEEHIQFKIDQTRHDEVKRLIRLAAPSIKSSHCAEAVARGFQFNTNAALTSELKDNGSFERNPDRAFFEAFLAERGYDVEGLQAALFTDAVRIAAESPWRPLRPDPDALIVRNCVGCFDAFASFGRSNLLCDACKIRDGRVRGINHMKSVGSQIRKHAFLEGTTLEEWSGLKVRPGWADFLSGDALKREVSELIAHRSRVQKGDFTELPEWITELFEQHGYLDVMDDLEVARKTAKAYFHEGKTEPLGEVYLDG